MRMALLLLFLSIGTAALAGQPDPKAAPRPKAPAVPRHSYGRPIYFLGQDGYRIGHAAIVRFGTHRVLVASYHMFGPTRMRFPIPPSRLPDVIRRIDLSTYDGRSFTDVTRRGLLREGRAVSQGPNTDVGPDLIAFEVAPSAKVDALPMAAQNPRRGEPVYLIGRAKEQTDGRVFHPLRVDYSSPTVLSAPIPKEFPLTTLSGAPVVNAKGEFAGIYVGYVDFNGGRDILVNPVSAIRARLHKAYASKPQTRNRKQR